MGGTICLRFLGTVQVERDGAPLRGLRSRKALALLGYLAAQGQPLPRERLVDLFWPDQPEARGRANLSWVLNHIGTLLPGCLQTDRHSVSFHCPAHLWLDTEAFAELESRGDAASLAGAADLVRGEFLDGLYLEGCAEFELWLVGERERWRQRATGELEALVRYHSQRAEYAEALRFARRLLNLEPWREETHRQVMRLLAWSGQRAAALIQYETCCRVLADELEVEPAAETTQLYELIRAGEWETPTKTPADAPRGPPAGEWRTRNLPPATYTRLFGVKGILDRLLARLEAPDDHWLVSLEGMGGLGKTTLAREASGRLAEISRFAEIVWLTAKREFYTWRGLEQRDQPALTFEQVLDAIADQLGEDMESLSLMAKQGRIRALLQAQPVLVVVDNLDTLVDCESLPAQLRGMANPSKFLLTSRHRVTPCPGLSALQLYELAEPDSLDLVRYVGRQRGLQELVAAEDERLLSIVAATGGNPLALELVAGQLVHLPLGRVLAMLQNAEPGTDPFYRFLYRSAWDLLSGSARLLLICMALLPASGSCWEDLAAITTLPGEELDAAIAELGAISLVQSGGLEEKNYTIHRLTHHFVLAEAADRTTIQRLALRMGEVYLAYAAQHHRDWAALKRRQDHLLQAMQLCGDLGEDGQRILVQGTLLLNSYILRRASWATWLPHLERARRVAAELGDQAAEADLMNRMGLVKKKQREMESALDLHQQAADAFRRLGDNLNLARALRWQGNVHYTRNDLPTALACYEQARALVEPLDESRELSIIYNNIANVHSNQGEWEQALACYSRALALLDPKQDPRQVSVLLNNLGLLHWNMGYWRQAVHDLLQARSLLEASGDRISQANNHHYLCLVYTDMEGWEAALAHGQRALVLRKELGPAEGLAEVYTDLATVHLRVGDAEQAGQLLELAAPLWQKSGQAAGLARVHLLRGDLHSQQGAWREAGAAYKTALALLEPLGDLPLQLTALLGLTGAHLALRDDRAAQALLPHIEDLSGRLARADFQVRVLWLQADLDPPTARAALDQALALCSPATTDNDRLRWLGHETQARLEAIAHPDPTCEVSLHNLTSP